MNDEVPCSIRCGPQDCTKDEFGPHCENRHCAVGSWSDSDGNICDQKNKEAKAKGKWNRCESDSNESKLKQLGYQFKSHNLSYKRTRKVVYGRKGIGNQCPGLTEDVTCKYKTCVHQFWLLWS